MFMEIRHSPGTVRDAIVTFMEAEAQPVSIEAIYEAVDQALGSKIPRSSIRSYLNINTPERFERVTRGQYHLLSPYGRCSSSGNRNCIKATAWSFCELGLKTLSTLSLRIRLSGCTNTARHSKPNCGPVKGASGASHLRLTEAGDHRCHVLQC